MVAPSLFFVYFISSCFCEATTRSLFIVGRQCEHDFAELGESKLLPDAHPVIMINALLPIQTIILAHVMDFPPFRSDR